jgi:RND family efflux transporter MFP subunit
MNLSKVCLLLVSSLAVPAQQAVETVPVISKRVERTLRLPGELLPFERVDLHARVTAFVEKVDVDRGSVVQPGQLLISLAAPELRAQRAEAEAKAVALESQRAEAQAKLVAAQSTYEHLRAAAATPGVVAGNELVLAQQAVDAARAVLQAHQSSIQAARAAVQALRELESYLRVTAPIHGVITERLVHPGALVGPASTPLLRVEQIWRLRLVVAVPESEVAGILGGARVSFTTAAWPGQSFSGVVARIAHSLDSKTRTMAVELDVSNPGGQLAPGMYPEVSWPVRRMRPSLLVPPSSIVTTTESSFVIRVRDGRAEYVDVKRGPTVGELVEVFGALLPGDTIVRRGSDEIREGTRLN